MPLPPTPPAPRRQARRFATLSTLAAIALLVGCSDWRDPVQTVRPEGPDAKTCRARCDLLRTQCQQRQETREKECAQGYSTAKADYDLCVASGARNCLAPYTCLGADLSICEREHAPCTADCGGAPGARPDTATTPAAPPAPDADKTGKAPG